jgi:predicted enzyme related to lactoylglutathione lyase
MEDDAMKRLGTAVLAVLAGSALLAACSSTSATTPPAGAAPTAEYHPGKFVWRDLVTRDPAACRRFYGALLGWEFDDTTRQGHPYTVARFGGRPVAGIVEHPEPTDAPALWLSYLSVANVDEVVERVSARGGKTVYAPVDLEVARVAVIEDPQGGALGLARLAGGDPPDRAQPSPGHFFWMEYLAEDASAAVDFYTSVFGFEPSVQETAHGIDYHVLRRGGRTRAGLFQIPKDADESVDPNWLPYVMVDDPGALASRAESLGGTVVLAPEPGIRSGTLAIVADPTGGALALQKWPL